MTDPIPKDLLDQRLPDWYRAVSVDVDGKLIAARKAAIETLAEGLQIDDSPAVVAYAHGRIPNGKGLIERIRDTAREHDEAFAGGVKDVEPRAMLACAIAHRLATQPRDEVSIAVSLLCQSAAFRGFRSTVKGQDLVGLADRQLRVASDEARRPPTAATTTALVGLGKRVNDLARFPEDPNPVVNSVMEPWGTGVLDALDSLARRIDSIDKKLARSARMTAEQLDQTVWLLEEYCELAGKPWSEVAKDSVPLFAATELAEISAAPGAPGAAVMLKSTLVKAGHDPAAQSDTLGCVQRSASHLASWPETEGHDLTPLTAAVAAFRELGGKSGWRPLAEKRRGGGKFRAATASEVAEQAHRELLIARQLSYG